MLFIFHINQDLSVNLTINGKTKEMTQVNWGFIGSTLIFLDNGREIKKIPLSLLVQKRFILAGKMLLSI